ncbi:Na+/H+ antiporter subunit E [Actinomadura parmotrematis]|uniref:Na+/H+ antiporter subunit E n=1 Tax=Actinomadura parmotrematis TaxID=2864039 RepID=A0ABS7FLW1_9ACTN|nr:Na+/H+ antiporter subunit E [Actinomadura parmotrematis]MBW8480990.1 Na+/H+ antiporter subunit E [Actinomadura parmotrematis]
MEERPRYSVRVAGRTVQLPLVAWLTLIWLLMGDRFSVANVLSGIAAALVLVVVFPFPPLDPGLRFHPAGFARFAGRFAYDMARAAGPLALQAFDTGLQRRANSVVAVTLRTHSDFILTATSIALSALPGALVVDVRRQTGTLFLHALGAADDAGVESVRRLVLDQEARVVRAFGTREDRALIEGGTNP